MRPSKSILICSICLIIISTACGASPETILGDQTNPDVNNSLLSREQPKGDRKLEIHITEPENGNYDKALGLAKDLGSESVSLSIFWDDLEISPGVYAPDPNWLEIANLYYPPQGMKVSLVISVLDTTEKRVPDSIQSYSFSDPVLISAFKSLLDYIKTQIPDLELESLAIGNEIDGVLGNDPLAWDEYSVFFREVADYARGVWPDVPVGTKIMFSGHTGQMAQSAQVINKAADIVMVTYYPLEGDFSVQDPAIVMEDFDLISELYSNREIHISEIGYPTSEVNQSSPERQADFIRYMFQAWDKNEEQITNLSYSWLTDLPDSSVQELENYYGLSDPEFAEFLRTLGLRTYPENGKDKLGFQAFLAEIKARGW